MGASGLLFHPAARVTGGTTSYGGASVASTTRFQVITGGHQAVTLMYHIISMGIGDTWRIAVNYYGPLCASGYQTATVDVADVAGSATGTVGEITLDPALDNANMAIPLPQSIGGSIILSTPIAGAGPGIEFEIYYAIA